MKTLIILSALLLLVSCKSEKSSSSSSTESSNSSWPVMSYYSPSSSPSTNSSPSFIIKRKDGSGYNSGTVVKGYSDGTCTNEIVSSTLNSYTTAVTLDVAISVPGTFVFSVSIFDPFIKAKECTNALTYTLTAPSTPTSIDLLSEASPSSNPNPRIRVNGIGANGAEIYLNNTCTGEAFTASTSSVFILPPLQNGAHSLYAKTVTSTGVKSACSPKLLDYQAQLNFTTDLSITPNAGFYDYSVVESADIDGDGMDDLIYSKLTTGNSGILFGTGTGSFGATKSLYFSDIGRSIKVIDVDNDGKKDILIGGDGYRGLYLFHNDGGRNFTSSRIENLGYNAFDSIDYIEVADINGDGKKRHYLWSSKRLQSLC